jgi:hypothetical protein
MRNLIFTGIPAASGSAGGTFTEPGNAPAILIVRTFQRLCKPETN